MKVIFESESGVEMNGMEGGQVALRSDVFIAGTGCFELMSKLFLMQVLSGLKKYLISGRRIAA